jgi:coproporphyrinogen III oxidase
MLLPRFECHKFEDRAQEFFAGLQDRICEMLESADRKAAFTRISGEREEEDARASWVGDLFEKLASTTRR